VETVKLRKILVGHPVVVARKLGDIHGSLGPFEAIQGNARILKGLVSGFQEQALLGIHAVGLSRRNRPESGIKGGNVLVEEESGAEDERFLRSGVGMVEGIGIPAI
jgi:hypothetical protein